MKRLIPRLPLSILIALAISWLMLMSLYIFPRLLPTISGFATELSLPVVFVLLVLCLIAFIKERNKLLPLLAVALIVFVSYLQVTKHMYWGARAHFYLNKAAYEKTAQRMLSANDDAERARVCGENCYLLADSKSVGFHYVHGFLNWHDIVYDPGGAIMNRRNTLAEAGQFAPYFRSAEHLTGDWYLGHFGD